jgi:hypothetical protein
MWTPGVNAQGAAIYQESPDPPDGRGVAVTLVRNVYADPCDPSAGALVPELGPSVEDLADALANQPGTEVSVRREVTLGGFSGTYLDYVFTGEPGCPSIARFPTAAGDRQAILDERDQVWILDVDGVRLVIDAFSFQGVTAAELAELQQVVESIQIEP